MADNWKSARCNATTRPNGGGCGPPIWNSTNPPCPRRSTLLLRSHAGRQCGAENEFRGLIATLDGRPVGLVHYLFHRHGWKIENVCYLQDLYADPEVRGKGIGRALIEAVYAAADAEGCPNVYWLTQDFNETARRLYDRIGKLTPFVKYTR
jgi:GNAT superfamily N-acetyltransferase